jgi:hypothetical protein
MVSGEAIKMYPAKALESNPELVTLGDNGAKD